jgi:chromosome segregation ATPase
MQKSSSGSSQSILANSTAAGPSFDEEFGSDGGLLLTEYCQKLDIAARQRLMWMKSSFRKLHDCFKSTGHFVSQAERAQFQATVRGLYDEILLDRKSNFSITLASVSRCEHLEKMLEAQQEHINNLELKLAHSQNATHIDAYAAEVRSLKTTVHEQRHELAASEEIKKSFNSLQLEYESLAERNQSISSELDETMHMLRDSDMQNAEISKTLEQKTAEMEMQAHENRRLQIVLFSQRQQLAICVQQMKLDRTNRSPSLALPIKSFSFQEDSDFDTLNSAQEQRLPEYETLLDDLFTEPNDEILSDP